MEFRVLRYFPAAAGEGSLSAAAETLHIAHPALSGQLREFEQEQDNPLFIRGAHGIKRRDEGLHITNTAEKFLGYFRGKNRKRGIDGT